MLEPEQALMAMVEREEAGGRWRVQMPDQERVMDAGLVLSHPKQVLMSGLVVVPARAGAKWGGDGLRWQHELEIPYGLERCR